jgi:hypothetical protein
MRTWKVIFVCLCLAGFTQLVWCQEKSPDATHGTRGQGIPGYFDPRTSTFSTKAEPAGANADSEVPPAGTPILFRETFTFAISALDIPASAVIFCHAGINTTDPLGSYQDGNTAVATRSGNNATCSVSILTNWVLADPTTDKITANVFAYADQTIQVGSSSELIERFSGPPTLTLPVPANTQTINTNVAITM